MSEARFILRVGAIASTLAAVLLTAQIALGLRIGNEIAALQSLEPLTFIQLVSAHAGAIQVLMAVDDAFIIAHLIAFAGLAAATRERRALAPWDWARASSQDSSIYRKIQLP